MKTSPILGLPIEEGTDTRRDFPSRVDEPRTLAIENHLTAIQHYAHIKWGSGSQASGTAKLTATPASTAMSGITWANGTATIAKKGRYLVTFAISNSGLTGTLFVNPQIKAGGFTLYGSLAANSGSYSIMVFSQVVSLNVGATVEAWIQAQAACTRDEATLTIDYLAPY